MDDKTTLTSRAAWLVLGKTLAFCFAFALPLLLVRRMSQYEFGLYKQIFLFVSTATVLLPLGFHMSAYYFLPREPQWGKQIVLNILLFEVLIAIIASAVILLRPSLLTALFNNEEIGRLAPSIALAVLTFIVSALLDHMMLARGETKLATVLVVGSQLTKTVALLGAAIVFGTVRSLLYASIIQASIQVVVLVVYLRARFANFWHGFRWSIFKEQLAYALPLGIAAELWMLQTTLDNFFVSYTFGPNDYAIYAVGCFQLPLVIIVTESLGLTTIPRLSQMQKEGRLRDIVNLLARMMRKQAVIFIPLYVLLLVIGREFIVALFTSQYLRSWPIFAINLILVPLAIVTSATDPVMRSYSEHRYFLLRMRIALVALLATALWFGTAKYGLIGAISIMAGVNIIQTVIIAVKTTKILELNRADWLLFRDLGKILFASLIAGVASLLVKLALVGSPAIITVLVCGAVFGIVYLALLLLLKTATPEEQEGFWRMAGRLHSQLFSKGTTPAQSI